MTGSEQPLITLQGVTKVFFTDEVETHAPRGVHLEIRKGEYVSIAGPSGCGKSTLLSIIGLLDSPSEGSYVLNGRPVHDLTLGDRARIRNRQIGFIFQSFNLIGDLTVFENVELPLTYRGTKSSERAQRTTAALERGGWPTGRGTSRASSRRAAAAVAVARALVGDPLIPPRRRADRKPRLEERREAVMDLLRELHRNGATIMVTHDPRFAGSADRERPPLRRARRGGDGGGRMNTMNGAAVATGAETLPMIRTRSLERAYDTRAGRTYVLRRVDLDIAEGEFVTIMGPSGAGKSTLLGILGMLDAGWTGELHFLGHPVHALRPKERAALNKSHIGFVFQSYHLLDDLTVAENLDLPLSYKNVKGSERASLVADALDRFHIVAKKDLYPSQLSGGQQQLVAVARALIAKPKLVLADEPTGEPPLRSGTGGDGLFRS
jgi:putative ABC transport system ATP-binding protein